VGAAAAAVYLGTLGNRPVLDDGWAIFDNPLVRSLANATRIFREPYGVGGPSTVAGVYRPITTLSHALNYALGGREVVGYHAVNLVLHLLCSLLVLALARRVVAAVAPARANAAALAAGLLFAVHPVHVEAVAALTGRAELLAALAVLCALHLAGTRERGRWRLPAALFAVLLGVLSKENAAAAPLLFALVALAAPRAAGLPARPGLAAPEGRRALVALLGLSAAMAAAAGLYVLVRPGAGALGSPVVAQWFAGRPRSVVAGTMSRAFLEYLRLLVFPHPLGVDFYYSSRIPFTEALTAPALWSALVWGTVLLAGLLSLRRAPVRALGILWIFAALLPVSNIVPTGVLMAERLLYLPSVGFCVWAGHGAAALREEAARRWPGRAAPWQALPALFLTALAVLSAKTVLRGAEWRDARTLWEAELRHAPLDPVVNNNLAVEYLSRGEVEKARQRLEVTLRVAPSYWRAHVNLGIALQKSGEPERAMQSFQMAQLIDPSAPSPLFFAGLLLAEEGRLEEAEALLGRAERLAPEDPRTRLYRGRYLARLGRTGEARAELERAATLDPADRSVRKELEALEGPGAGSTSPASRP
jgi:tetratricopeptide (TPR) repeat protein